MRRGIERVVNRRAHARAERLIRAHDRRAAAVGENEIVTWNQREKRVGHVMSDTIQSRRRIHIPKRDVRVRGAQIEHGSFEQFVEHADAARFDN